MCNFGVELGKGGAQSKVHSMDGTFTVGGGDLGHAVHAHLDDRGSHLSFDGGLFVDDLVIDEIER